MENPTSRVEIATKYVDWVAGQLCLGREDVVRLAKFSDGIVRYAYEAMRKKNPERPFQYLLRICSTQEERQQSAKVAQPQHKYAPSSSFVAENQSVADNSLKVGGFKSADTFFTNQELTAVQIAQEIAKIKAINSTDMFGNGGYMKRMLSNWVNKEYLPTGDELEAMALKYIDSIRVELGCESSLDIPQNAQILTTTTEAQPIDINVPLDKKDLALGKYEDNSAGPTAGELLYALGDEIDEWEEVY